MAIIYQKDYDKDYFDWLKKEHIKTPPVSKDTKIIFLDVDGVLNSEKWLDDHMNSPHNEMIDPAAAAKVMTIAEKTGAKFVISSSRRWSYLDMPNGFQEIQAFFAKFGITGIVGWTPRLKGERRCREIATWLTEHEVAGFVIIDDDGGAQLMNKLVKCRLGLGIQDHHVEEAIKILNGDI